MDFAWTSLTIAVAVTWGRSLENKQAAVNDDRRRERDDTIGRQGGHGMRCVVRWPATAADDVGWVFMDLLFAILILMRTVCAPNGSITVPFA